MLALLDPHSANSLIPLNHLLKLALHYMSYDAHLLHLFGLIYLSSEIRISFILFLVYIRALSRSNVAALPMPLRTILVQYLIVLDSFQKTHST